MQYKFNDRIIFDFETGTLSRSDTLEDAITIPNASNRLLQLLIVHQGDVVSREVIFKKVWDDYGMVSSNNNLNQCVSKLRQNLKALGFNEKMIVTVPKVGFMLHSKIQIVYCEDEKENDVAPSNAIPPVPTRATVGNMFSRAAYFRYVCAAAGFVCVVLAGIAFYVFKPAIWQESYLGKSENCEIFMSNSPFRAKPAFSDDILAHLAGKKILCQPDEYLLLMRGNQIKSYISNTSRLFIFRCKVLHENKGEFCYDQTGA